MKCMRLPKKAWRHTGRINKDKKQKYNQRKHRPEHYLVNLEFQIYGNILCHHHCKILGETGFENGHDLLYLPACLYRIYILSGIDCYINGIQSVDSKVFRRFTLFERQFCDIRNPDYTPPVHLHRRIHHLIYLDILCQEDTRSFHTAHYVVLRCGIGYHRIQFAYAHLIQGHILRIVRYLIIKRSWYKYEKRYYNRTFIKRW